MMRLALVPMLVLMLALMQSGQAAANTIRDTEVEDALLAIARPMAKDAGIDAANLQIRIISDPAYNAFVTVENTIFVHSGLIILSESSLEVAGVIAHEIGHLASGHVQRRGETVDKAGIATVMGMVAAIALTASGHGDAAVGTVMGSVDRTNRIILGQSRQDESVADEWAMQLMEKQHLSTRPMAQMMARLASERLLPTSRQSEYYRTHPGARERSSILQAHAASLDYADDQPPPTMEDAFIRIKAKLRSWTEPPNQTLINATGDAELDRYRLAVALFRLGDISGSIALMRSLVEDYPANPYYHEFLGDVLLSAGQASLAVPAYEAALARLDPDTNRGQILLSLGRALIATGSHDGLTKAIPILEEANRLEPDWGFVKHQLGISYGRMGRLADADLVLAERALMLGNKELAKRLAKRVTDNTEATDIQHQLAMDIVLQTEH